MSATTVLVSRKWHKPEITITVNDEAIGIQMPITEYLKALVAEAGNPTLLTTKAGLERRLQAASEKVVEGMKSETARAV